LARRLFIGKKKAIKIFASLGRKKRKEIRGRRDGKKNFKKGCLKN